MAENEKDLHELLGEYTVHSKKADRLLRKLEKTSKVLTQHIQTAILGCNLEGEEKWTPGLERSFKED